MKRSILIFLAALVCSTAVSGQTDSTEAYIPKWGFGMAFSPCTGMYFLTGHSKEKLSEGWCFANVGMTISYSKLHFTLEFGGLSGSLKEELSYGQAWKKDNRFGSTNLQLSTGYELLDKKYFRILPYVTTGMTVFNTKFDSTGAKPALTRWMPSVAVGTAFDFKINWQCLYLRAATGIYPAYFYPLKMNGALCYVNLGIGFYAGPGTRVTGIYKEPAATGSTAF